VDRTGHALVGQRLLIVEDEYLIAADLTQTLEKIGIVVVGPAGSVETALELVKEEGSRLDGAVLDVNLHGQRVYPVAEALAGCGVPFLFTTGYDAEAIPDLYSKVPRCEKPVDIQKLIQWLDETAAIHAGPMAPPGGSADG
jgi:CheY-like chemotaxis protein